SKTLQAEVFFTCWLLIATLSWHHQPRSTPASCTSCSAPGKRNSGRNFKMRITTWLHIKDTESVCLPPLFPLLSQWSTASPIVVRNDDDKPVCFLGPLWPSAANHECYMW
uniref:Chemokine interleukin-8-like domain-containing protein n=1 Tax=Amphiprion ocellaris TaxID=80972 RepID=A0AAQ5X223_AMPOC